MFGAGKLSAMNYGGITRITLTVCSFPNLLHLYYMARIARLVVPGLPHHVSLRGNRCEQVFFEDGDFLFRLLLRWQ